MLIKREISHRGEVARVVLTQRVTVSPLTEPPWI